MWRFFIIKTGKENVHCLPKNDSICVTKSTLFLISLILFVCDKKVSFFYNWRFQFHYFCLLLWGEKKVKLLSFKSNFLTLFHQEFKVFFSIIWFNWVLILELCHSNWFKVNEILLFFSISFNKQRSSKAMEIREVRNKLKVTNSCVDVAVRGNLSKFIHRSFSSKSAFKSSICFIFCCYFFCIFNIVTRFKWHHLHYKWIYNIYSKEFLTPTNKHVRI